MGRRTACGGPHGGGGAWSSPSHSWRWARCCPVPSPSIPQGAPAPRLVAALRPGRRLGPHLPCPTASRTRAPSPGSLCPPTHPALEVGRCDRLLRPCRRRGDRGGVDGVGRLVGCDARRRDQAPRRRQRHGQHERDQPPAPIVRVCRVVTFRGSRWMWNPSLRRWTTYALWTSTKGKPHGAPTRAREPGRVPPQQCTAGWGGRTIFSGTPCERS